MCIRDSPGTPQIQNIIPTTFFKTTSYAAPILGIVGALFVFGLGMTYPVSYTHLDVYKRQAWSTGVGC